MPRKLDVLRNGPPFRNFGQSRLQAVDTFLARKHNEYGQFSKCMDIILSINEAGQLFSD